MDNKRMFSAPLELLERVCMLPSKESMLANHQGIIDRGRAQDELRALLAQPPVAQHQGETVTAICRDCFTEQPKGVPCKTCAGVEAKRSAQHQGEPVAWAETDVLDFMSVPLRHAEYSGLSPSDILDGLRYMSDKGKPAFYAGEAERLRAELVEWKKRCQYNANTAHDVGRERDTLHTELAEAQQKYRDELGKRLAGEVKSEAKLAERDALLRDINKRHSSGVDFDLPADLAARVAAVCATSAEPIIDLCAESAHEFVPFRTECVRCGEPYSAEPSAPKCKYCGDTGQFMVGSSGDPSDGNAPIMERCEDCELGQTSAPVEPCKHEWSDDGGLLLVCTACGAQEDHAPHWRDMASAPRDGTMLRLLVAFEEHPTEDADEAPTIGSNNFDNDGEDRWQFAGWCWTHDHFTDGKGEPVGWLPMLDAPKTTAGHGLHCLTCNDEGAIGNIENAEPCPDCAAAPPEFEQVKP